MAGGPVPPLEVDLMHDLATDSNALSRSLPYLNETTALMQDQTDVLLVLDSSEILPVHALYLVAHSSIFSGILDDHFTGEGHRKFKTPTSIPLPDCSQGEAEMFLCYLYRVRAKPELTPESARCIVKLAHRFDVRVALEQCDEYLAQQAVLNITPTNNHTTYGHRVSICETKLWVCHNS